jgi:hypothetical protein
VYAAAMNSRSAGRAAPWNQPCGCCATTAAAKQQLQNRKLWYDKLYASMISRQTSTYNQLLDARKKQLLAHVVDDTAVKDVLEVGMGSGANLPYYASTRKVSCVVWLLVWQEAQQAQPSTTAGPTSQRSTSCFAGHTAVSCGSQPADAPIPGGRVSDGRHLRI